MSVLTGLAGWAGLLGLLVIARMGSGLGRTVNEPVHASPAGRLLPARHAAQGLRSSTARPTRSRASPPSSSAPAPGSSAGRRCSSSSPSPTVLLIGATLRLPDRRDRGRSSTRDARGGTRRSPSADDGDRGDQAPCRSFGEARRSLFGIPSLQAPVRRVVPPRLRLPPARHHLGRSSSRTSTASRRRCAASHGLLRRRRRPRRPRRRRSAWPAAAIADGNRPGGWPPSRGCPSRRRASAWSSWPCRPVAAGSLLFSVLVATGLLGLPAGVLPAVSHDHPARRSAPRPSASR